jgi:hypothetical protein
MRHRRVHRSAGGCCVAPGSSVAQLKRVVVLVVNLFKCFVGLVANLFFVVALAVPQPSQAAASCAASRASDGSGQAHKGASRQRAAPRSQLVKPPCGVSA